MRPAVPNGEAASAGRAAAPTPKPPRRERVKEPKQIPGSASPCGRAGARRVPLGSARGRVPRGSVSRGEAAPGFDSLALTTLTPPIFPRESGTGGMEDPELRTGA